MGAALAPGQLGGVDQSLMIKVVRDDLATNPVTAAAIQAADGRLGTLEIADSITLSNAAAANLRKQLADQVTGFIAADGTIQSGTGFSVAFDGSTYTITFL